MARAQGSRSLLAFTWFVAIASIIAAHAMLIGYKTYANVDEGYAAALAARLLDGAKLYQGAISQRGPLMYYAFEAIARGFGWDNIVGLRCVALALALLDVGLVYWAGRKLLSRDAALVAVLVTAYALSFGFPPEDGVAINGETLQLPLMVMGVVMGALAVRHAPSSRGRIVRLVAAGLLFGTAASIKQSVALHPAVIVLWLVIDARRRRARVPVIETCALFVAVLVVPSLFVLHAAFEGTLRDLYYYTVVYNRDIHMQPTAKHFKWLPWVFFRMLQETAFPMVLLLIAGRGFPWLWRRVRAAFRLGSGWALGRGFGVQQYLALHLVIAVVSASVLWRFFPHYYIQALPFLALCIGAVVAPAFRKRSSAAHARGAAWGFGVFIVFAAAIGCDFSERADGRVAHDESVQTIARVVKATTAPTDRIFVWGFSPWIYGYAQRKPAGRYVFETYVTGFVPWYWEKLDVERGRVVPGSQEALLADLEREDPAVIIDAGSVMMARPMRLYRVFDDLLHTRYCFDMRIGAFDLYRRRREGTCERPFPRPAEVVDFMGRDMPIPLPRTLDWETSKRLPSGSFFKPTYFLDAPKPIGLDAARDAKREKEELEGAADGFYVKELEP